jgi:hypothetical protein
MTDLLSAGSGAARQSRKDASVFRGFFSGRQSDVGHVLGGVSALAKPSGKGRRELGVHQEAHHTRRSTG